jgi:hypothetical protein
MRSVAWPVAAVAVVACAAPTDAAPGPPAIREPFTVLACPPHPITTVGVEGCLERMLLRSDRAIDARVSVIYGLLRSRSSRSSFVRGEEAWLRYRRSSCSAQASAYARGSAEPIAYARCEVTRNTTHLRELAEMQSALRRR